ncbi:MAG: carboxypeptidase regulatory-like domain-containing protein, partial [Acidobacteriaceae bacterium]|nr:carboxypeptidase regulatory-like domain-containing protein [Acidobacteriaceae bacterium]
MLVRLVALAAFTQFAVLPQLNTGVVNGFVQSKAGTPISHARIVITGASPFRIEVTTDVSGHFTIALPSGVYDVSGTAVRVRPLETIQVNVVAGPDGALEPRGYPEAFSLLGILSSRDPASVTEPVDFWGVNDTRLGVNSQRAISWTETQYRFMGMDATDSYQPGRLAMLPDIQSLDTVVVRDTSVDAFLTQPHSSWHGALDSSDTGSALSSSNVPSLEQRFRWFTRDHAEAGGRLSRWADFYAAATAEW